MKVGFIYYELDKMFVFYTYSTVYYFYFEIQEQ